MTELDDRLAKRYWLLQNIDYVLREKDYYLNVKTKEGVDFHSPKVVLWSYNDVSGRVELDALTQ